MATSPTIIKTLCGVSVSVTVFESYTPAQIMAVPLTPCCNATGKGAESGVVCRKCFTPVPFYFGTNGHEAIAEAVADAGCGIPDECAHHTMWQAEQLVPVKA